METSQVVLESSKFLKELQDEAWKTIKATIASPNDNIIQLTGFRSTGLLNQISNTSSICGWYVKLKINNSSEIEIEGTFDSMCMDKRQIASEILDSLKTQINNIINKLIQDSLKPLFEGI